MGTSVIITLLLLVAIAYYFYNKTNYFKSEPKNLTIDDKFNIKKQEREKELNKLLDKISASGMDSLSQKEKDRLKELSR
ncbi:MAG: hypothetical protein RLZZ175_2349 [Bacteroidota bacterium]|jgi:hypothetical protein